MRASTRYKRPESVLVVVHTAGGEVLMLRRRGREGAQPFWQSVTGSLRWDERSALDAARRELREETGLSAGAALRDLRLDYRFPIQPPWRARYAPQVRENHEHAFAVQLPARTAIRLNPREHDAYVWLPFAEAAERASSWTNRDVIRRLAASAAAG